MEMLSGRGGSLPSASSVSLLTTREWLWQEIPTDVEDFGNASSGSRGRRSLQYIPYWDQLPGLVDAYVEGLQDSVSNSHLRPIDQDIVTGLSINERDASFFFLNVLMRVIWALEVPLTVNSKVSVPGSRGPNVGADERTASLAASPTPKADFVVNNGDRQVLVVEIKRPGLFRRNVHAEILGLHLLGQGQQEADGPSIAREEGVNRAVTQLFGYVKKLNLKYRILSSFDLIYDVHRQGDYGETLFISDGIDRGSKKFLGVIAFMLRTVTEDPGDFKNEVSKPISPTRHRGGLKRRGPQDEEKEKRKQPSGRMKARNRNRNQSHLEETPAELLHLAQDHFATGWSGKIVRGNYEGQSVVVKLAPVGSHRAEALMTEVSAYHMLKEFWGKYVPPLVLYGTTVGRIVMYIATEEFNGYEMGMGPLSQEVVNKIFDALAIVHQCGILHGDIRRSNILVAEGQLACVRFIDFGFACFHTSDEGCRRESAQLASLVSEFTSSRFQLAQKVV